MTLENLFWNKDWAIGLAVAPIVLFIAWLGGLTPLDNAVYHQYLRYQNQPPAAAVTLVTIDDASLAQMGELPWGRQRYAQLLERLAPYANVIALNVPLDQAQQGLNVPALEELSRFYDASPALQQLPIQTQQLNQFIAQLNQIRPRSTQERASLEQLKRFYEQSIFAAPLSDEVTVLQDKLAALRQELAIDNQLVNRLQTYQRVVISSAALSTAEPNTPSVIIPAPAALARHQLTEINNPFDATPQPYPLQIDNMRVPLASFLEASSGFAVVPPTHGVLQHYPLVVRYQQAYFPTLPLLLVAKYWDIHDIHVSLGQGVQLGEVRLNTDSRLQIEPLFYRQAVRSISAADILTGKFNPEQLKNQIVLIGITATAHSLKQLTPLGEMPQIVVQAQMVSNLLQRAFYQQPESGFAWQIAIFLSLLGYCVLLLPRLRSPAVHWASLALGIILLSVQFILLSHQWHLSLMSSLLLLGFSHLGLLLKRLLVAYSDAFRLHPEAVESNRLLGLAFQGQGELELAFEKFRLCPPTEEILGLVYNLGLDYEMRRDYRQAATVYRYLLSHSPAFRDTARRLERLQSLADPVFYSSSNQLLTAWTEDSEYEKPILGRYQLERVLGKGAMGMVYLGRDPKLNRLVAIKTLALAQEFEQDVLQEATTRFFQEASAAGRLQHANIIAVFDAGEENDLAYLAMEFFKGGDLKAYTRKDNLLPINNVIELIQQIARALDYAHSQGVVHRDIKPANILYNRATGYIKITDFGIAQITNLHKTKTGVILGTPSYMSPEQLAGKPLDGRTDLFSLGIMSYQLLSGELPFQAESIASLTFKISHETPPDLQALRPELPAVLVEYVNKMLAKDPAQRFARGNDIADALHSIEFLNHAANNAMTTNDETPAKTESAVSNLATVRHPTQDMTTSPSPFTPDTMPMEATPLHATLSSLAPDSRETQSLCA